MIVSWKTAERRLFQYAESLLILCDQNCGYLVAYIYNDTYMIIGLHDSVLKDGRKTVISHVISDVMKDGWLKTINISVCGKVADFVWSIMWIRCLHLYIHVEYVRTTVLIRIRDYITRSSLHTLFVRLVMPTLEYLTIGVRAVSSNT